MEREFQVLRLLLISLPKFFQPMLYRQRQISRSRQGVLSETQPFSAKFQPSLSSCTLWRIHQTHRHVNKISPIIGRIDGRGSTRTAVPSRCVPARSISLQSSIRQFERNFTFLVQRDVNRGYKSPFNPFHSRVKTAAIAATDACEELPITIPQPPGGMI